MKVKTMKQYGKKLVVALMGIVAVIAPVGVGEAAIAIESKITVAVMDFGTHAGASTKDINLIHAEQTTSEYIIERLVDNEHFDVIDWDLAREQLAAENLTTVGLIDPDSAKRIGEILNVKYIIYGNVNDITASGTGTQVMGSGVELFNVKAHVIARLMNVETGDIVMAAKGEGKSTSSLTKVGLEELGAVTIGTWRVSQISVHNALQKASYQAMDVLSERLYGKSKDKR